MTHCFFSNKAVEDLSEIWDYTYKTLPESEENKYYKLLIAFCEKIAEHPQFGNHYDEIEKGLQGYRACHHMLFYRVIKANAILILRIFPESMGLQYSKMQALNVCPLLFNLPPYPF